MCNLPWTRHSSLEKDKSLKHSCASPREWFVWSMIPKNKHRGVCSVCVVVQGGCITQYGLLSISYNLT